MKAPSLIGVDFDNTLVSYDALFHKVGLERGWFGSEVPVNKSDVRNYLRQAGREEDWTEMQGYVYGARMGEAALFPGVKHFFRACKRAGRDVAIISHKTLRPFRGEPYDLHVAAKNFLETQGFLEEADFGIPANRVFFELTKEAKLGRIGSAGCGWFIDDLPEFLGEPGFPAGVQRVLFDPNDLYREEQQFTRIKSWDQAREVCLC